MNDEDIIAIIRQYLADLATSGQASTGGNWAYDDYGVQTMLGYDPNAPPPGYPWEDWPDIGVANEWNATAADNGAASVGGDGMFLGAPYAPAYEPMTASYSPALAALQYGLEQRQQSAPREMRPYWEPFRGYSGAAQMLQPMSAPLVRRDLTPMLGVGPVKVQQTQENRKDTSKRRPLQPERQHTSPPERIVDSVRTYTPSPVVRALVAAPVGTAAAHNMFR